MLRIAGNRSALPPLVAAVVLLGTADSMVGSYLVLFAVDEAGLTPVQVGLFTAAPAAGGIVISTLVARSFDRRPTRGYVVAVAAVGALGYALVPSTTSFPLLLLIAVTLLAALNAAFPQLFALARVALGDGRAGRRSAPLLRSGWSLAWAVGPLAGAVFLAHTGFAGVFRAAAVALALTALVALAVPAPRAAAPVATGVPRTGPSGEQPPPRAVVALLATSVALFSLAIFAGSMALPLHVTRSLHLPDAAVGVLYSACASVEVLAALALVRLPARTGQRPLIAAAMGGFAVFCVLTVLAGGMALLLVGQVARGVAIAVVGAAGIRYFQDVMAPAAGRATTLYSNAGTAGALLAGALAGLSVQHWGYTATLLACGGAAVAGAATFCVATSRAVAGASIGCRT